MDIKHEINHKLFLQREENIHHTSYTSEFGMYKAIAAGNLELVKELAKKFRAIEKDENSTEKHGVLSKDPIRNQMYHFVILAAMVSRYCVEAGLEREVAYNMTDVYIDRADRLDSIEKLDELRWKMIEDFTDRMKGVRKQNVYSKQISRCIDYIYDNLNKKLRINDIADYLEMTPAYLSKLFSKEIGMPLSNYIREQRLKAAAEMLEFSDYSIAEIADYFEFSSQSHFTSTFQEYYKLTPKKYRDLHSAKEMV